MTTKIPWKELNLQQQTEARVTWDDRLEECLYEVDRDGEIQARFFHADDGHAFPDVLPPGRIEVLDAPPQAMNGDTPATLVPRIHLRPCPFQPRKNFDPDKLNKMALSERKHGIIQPIVVRPTAPSPEWPEARWEIITGESRWRASDERQHPETGEKLEALMQVPITVRHGLSDADILEMQLVENMQRDDLSVIEESDAFCMALEQRTADGAPVYKSVAEFAEKIGIGSEDYVRRRLSLRKLPKEGRKAIEQERLSFKAAEIVCQCPESVVPLFLDEVLNPRKYDQFRESDTALTAEEALEVKRARYVRELRGAPFDLDDANLVPVHTNEAGERIEGGACTDCPWNSALQKSEELKAARRGRHGGRVSGEGKFCLNPRCFAKKVEVHVAAELVKAKEEGCTVLNEKEAAKIIQHDGSLAPGATYVRLDAKPEESDRSKSAGEKCPTWEKIVDGETKPPVVVAVARGKVYRLVDRKLAITAAQKNKTDHYLSTSGGRGRSVQTEDAETKRKAAQDEAKLRGDISRAIMGELVAAVSAKTVDRDDWEAALLPIAERHAGQAGINYFEKRRVAAGEKHVTVELVWKKVGVTHRLPILVELLLAQDFAYAENPNSASIVPDLAKPMLKLFGVDPRKVEAAVRKAAKEKAKPKADQFEKLLPKARKLRASGEVKSVPGLMDALKIDTALAGKLWDALIDAESLPKELRDKIFTETTKRKLTLNEIDEAAKRATGKRYMGLTTVEDLQKMFAEVEGLPMPEKPGKPSRRTRLKAKGKGSAK